MRTPAPRCAVRLPSPSAVALAAPAHSLCDHMNCGYQPMRGTLPCPAHPTLSPTAVAAHRGRRRRKRRPGRQRVRGRDRARPPAQQARVGVPRGHAPRPALPHSALRFYAQVLALITELAGPCRTCGARSGRTDRSAVHAGGSFETPQCQRNCAGLQEPDNPLGARQWQQPSRRSAP